MFGTRSVREPCLFAIPPPRSSVRSFLSLPTASKPDRVAAAAASRAGKFDTKNFVLSHFPRTRPFHSRGFESIHEYVCTGCDVRFSYRERSHESDLSLQIETAMFQRKNTNTYAKEATGIIRTTPFFHPSVLRVLFSFIEFAWWLMNCIVHPSIG